MENLDERIANLSRAINRQIEDYARDTARRIKNVWCREDGKPVLIEDHTYLLQKIEDDERILSNMLWQLEKLIEERDGSKVSSAVSHTAAGRNGSHGDAPETE